jgi:hypothetical protein
MTERVPIRSARQDNRIFGFIESNKAFDLLGRPCADYDPKTGLLCDMLDGGVVGYVTLDGKLLGSSQVTQKLFPETWEVTSEESPRSYVNNIPSVLDAAEQQPTTRSADTGFDGPEVTNGPKIITVTSTQVSGEYRLPDSVKKVVREPFAQEQQLTEHSEMTIISPETPAASRIIAIETKNDVGGGSGLSHSESLTEHDGSAPRTSDSSDADKAIKNKFQTGDVRVLETVAAFMHRVAEYVGSADNDQRQAPSPFLDEAGNLKAELCDGAEASPTEKQDERTAEAVTGDGDGVLKAPGSHDQPGTMAFNETRLCEGDCASVEPAPHNTETIDLEDEGVEGRSDNSYDTTAAASFQDAKLGGSSTDIDHFDEKAQGKGNCTQSSDGDTVAVQISNVSQAESHGAAAKNDKIELENKYDTVRVTSPESSLGRDEEARARSDSIVSDHKPFDAHTVAEGSEGAFEFLRDMRSGSWLDSGPRDFNSSDESILEELKRLLKQLEK